MREDGFLVVALPRDERDAESWSWAVEGATAALSDARRHVRSIMLAERAQPETIDMALVLVSEVLTNAVIHGGPPILLSIDHRPPVWHVRVTDGSAKAPIVRPIAAGVEGGRGMVLVSAMASRWGVDPEAGGGKAVWFDVAD